MRKTLTRYWKDEDDGTLRKARVNIDTDKILEVCEYSYDQYDKVSGGAEMVWIQLDYEGACMVVAWPFDEAVKFLEDRDKKKSDINISNIIAN